MSSIQRIIEELGYSDSNALYYDKSSFKTEVDTHHSFKKIINELNPNAFYCVDNKPFILFFELSEKCISSNLIKKIWNAQIPLVFVSLENKIEIYNGCSIDKNYDLVLLEKFDNNNLDTTSPFSYWNISNSSFWSKYEKKLATPKLDEVMLDNITEATNQLKKSKCASFAVKLILRLIFIRYLIDRGVDLNYEGLRGDIIDSQNNFLNIIKDKDQLYDLFKHLKNQFNGNLFELFENELYTEKDLIDETSLETLYEVMSGKLILSSGQFSLFPLYDFNIIPVELISSIYERFLGDKRQQDDKAFYTPPYLVDYLLNQTIVPFLGERKECKVLDPACGSGIFLVQSARKLIENNLSKSNMKFNDEILLKIIVENIWGIDKNPEAIDVAIFSIYLTILDYKDPKTLRNFKLPLLKDRNLFVCDFFSKEMEKNLLEKHFDFIIGNPPWGGVKGEHLRYCINHKLPHLNNEISRSFILRTKDFADKDTCCCLIVTSKLFYNIKSPAEEFRKWLLTKTQIEKYIELAAVRELIFSKVRGPAGVIIYQFNSCQEENLSNELCHLTLKPNIFFKLFNIIMIEKNDFKYIKQALLFENDWAWKTVVFGYTHDFYLIKRLKDNYQSVSQIIENKQFSYGRGIEVHDGDKQDATHLKDKWLINARNGIDAFYINLQQGRKFTKDKIHRSKANKQEIFIPPYTLIKKGFNTQTYKYRAVFTEEHFIYPDAITGICGTQENKQSLLSLTGLFNSSLYAYFNLMLGSSSGIEREQGFPTEIFKYPAIDDNEISELVIKIQDEFRLDNESFLSFENESEVLIKKLDELILNKFGVSDDVFVDYALKVQIPLLSNNKVFWEEATYEQLVGYAQIFISYFNEIFSNTGKFILTKIYQGILNHYNAIEFILQDDKPIESVITSIECKNSNMELISKFMLTEVNDLFYQLKDVLNFGESSFYILKTNEYKNWHPAMAKLDLSDVIDSILAGSEVFQE